MVFLKFPSDFNVSHDFSEVCSEILWDTHPIGSEGEGRVINVATPIVKDPRAKVELSVDKCQRDPPGLRLSCPQSSRAVGDAHLSFSASIPLLK